MNSSSHDPETTVSGPSRRGVLTAAGVAALGAATGWIPGR
jgi:hypothetical protein